MKFKLILIILFMSTNLFAKEGRKPASEQRVSDCYNKFHSLAKGPIGTPTFDDIVIIEAGKAFLKCQTDKDGVLSKQNSDQSSGLIIEQLGVALKNELPEFSITFSQLVK